MGSKDKLINKIESRPVRNDITFAEISKYLSFFGFKLCRTKGSHHHFLHDSGRLITIPKQDTILGCYVREAIKAAHEVE